MTGFTKLKSSLRLLLIGAAVAVSVTPAHAFVAGKPIAEQLEACATCHGKTGNSELEKIPSLAGQPELFIVNQLILFREGLRKSEQMSPFAKGLDDKEIIALAAHISKFPPKSAATPADPALDARGAALSKAMRCGVCHLPNYAGREQIPRIAGQREDFLVHSLKEFRDQPRAGADTNMAAAVYGISDADILALAHYLARQP